MRKERAEEKKKKKKKLKKKESNRDKISSRKIGDLE